MRDDIAVKICKYINKNFRKKYKSNRDFSLTCGIDEKTVRLIQQEKYNPSSKLLKQICDSQDVKLSELFRDIGE